MMWLAFKAWVHMLVSEQKLFRRSVLVANCLQWGWVTYTVYTQLDQITGPVAAVFGTSQVVFGLVLKWYHDQRKMDESE